VPLCSTRLHQEPPSADRAVCVCARACVRVCACVRACVCMCLCVCAAAWCLRGGRAAAGPHTHQLQCVSTYDCTCADACVYVYVHAAFWMAPRWRGWGARQVGARPTWAMCTAWPSLGMTSAWARPLLTELPRLVRVVGCVDSGHGHKSWVETGQAPSETLTRDYQCLGLSFRHAFCWWVWLVMCMTQAACA